LTKLKEVGLFTDTVGSVPLSRSLIDIAVEEEKERMKEPSDTSILSLPPQSSAEKTLKTPPSIPAGTSENSVEVGDLPPDLPPTSAQIDMENRIKSAEDQIKHLGMTVAAGFEDLKKIMGGVVNPLSGAPKATGNPLTVDSPEEVETEPVNPGPEEPEDEGPFADMTKQQILDMAINSPEMIYALRNQGISPTSDTIQAVAHTTRWLALELTTYTQAAYERAVEACPEDGLDRG